MTRKSPSETAVIVIFAAIFLAVLFAWFDSAEPGSLGPVGPGLTGGARAATAQHGTGFRLRPGARACWRSPAGSGLIDQSVRPWGPGGDEATTSTTGLFFLRYGKPLGSHFCGQDVENFWKNGYWLRQRCLSGDYGPGFDCLPTLEEQNDCAATSCAPGVIPVDPQVTCKPGWLPGSRPTGCSTYRGDGPCCYRIGSGACTNACLEIDPPPPVEPPAPPPPPTPPVVPPALPGVCDPPCQRMLVPGGSIEWRPSLLSTGRVGPTPLSRAGGGR